MASSRGRGRYGAVGRRVAAAVDSFADAVGELDADRVGGRDALDLVEELSRAEHLVSAALLSAARRVAQTDLWKRGGHRTAGHWLSHVTVVSVGEAISLPETAEVVAAAPDTREALKAGEVSPRQAKAIGRAEQADPDAGRRLLEAASGRSTRETETDANRIVAAASPRHPRPRPSGIAGSARCGTPSTGTGWASAGGGSRSRSTPVSWPGSRPSTPRCSTRSA